MITARANYKWLSPTGRLLWTSPVCYVLLLLMMIGGPATLPPVLDYLSPPTQDEEQEGNDAEETTTTAGLPVDVPRSSVRKTGFVRAPSNVPLVLLNAHSLRHSYMLISVLAVGTFAKRNCVGAPLRC
jgi:hypothetical protein